jgi:hypothetical protein
MRDCVEHSLKTQKNIFLLNNQLWAYRLAIGSAIAIGPRVLPRARDATSLSE